MARDQLKGEGKTRKAKIAGYGIQATNEKPRTIPEGARVKT